jgi:hypothetical protein
MKISILSLFEKVPSVDNSNLAYKIQFNEHECYSRKQPNKSS